MRIRARRPLTPSDTAFTIIEVLIVLAIAGLILLIVFLSVSALQQSSRNYHRKHSVDLVAAELEDYKTSHGNGLPITVPEGDAFIATYLSEITLQYTVIFHDTSGPHSYVPPFDTIVIQYAHWCNRYGNGDAPTDPIASAGGNDTDMHYYVIWTKLEPNNIYCVDNHG